MEYHYPKFTPEMKKTHTILIPNMAVTQFRLMQAALASEGYQTEVLGNCGSEVAQLYIRDLVGSVTRPVRELKGFKKVFLKAGESRRLTFVLTPRELSFWRADMTFGQEAGDYRVWAGGDSDAELSGTFTVTK